MVNNVQPAGSDRTGPDLVQHEHHGIRGALETAAENYVVDALTSFVGPRRPDHWEEVLGQYERDHPRPDTAE